MTLDQQDAQFSDKGRKKYSRKGRHFDWIHGTSLCKCQLDLKKKTPVLNRMDICHSTICERSLGVAKWDALLANIAQPPLGVPKFAEIQYFFLPKQHPRPSNSKSHESQTDSLLGCWHVWSLVCTWKNRPTPQSLLSIRILQSGQMHPRCPCFYDQFACL